LYTTTPKFLEMLASPAMRELLTIASYVTMLSCLALLGCLAMLGYMARHEFLETEESQIRPLSVIRHASVAVSGLAVALLFVAVLVSTSQSITTVLRSLDEKQQEVLLPQGQSMLSSLTVYDLQEFRADYTANSRQRSSRTLGQCPLLHPWLPRCLVLRPSLHEDQKKPAAQSVRA